MGNTTDKLRAALASKEAISSAIIERGGTLAADAPLSAYAGAITSLQTGGGSAGMVIDSDLHIISGGISANVDSSANLVLYGDASAIVPKNDGTIALVDSGCDYYGTTNYFNGIPSCFAPDGAAIINSGTMEIYTSNSDSNYCPKFGDVDNYGTLGMSYRGEGAPLTLYGAVINRSGGCVYAPASSIVNHDGGTVDLGSGYVSSMTISGGSAVLSGTGIDSVDISDGSASMNLCSCSTIQIFGGYLTLEWATMWGDFYMSGGNASISGGTMCNLYISGGTADIGDISEGCSIYVSGTTLVSLWGSTGQPYISGGFVTLAGSATRGGIIEAGTLDITEYGYTEMFVVSGGIVNVSSGGSAQLEVNGGHVTIYSGGSARITGNSSCVTVEDGGSVEYW